MQTLRKWHFCEKFLTTPFNPIWKTLHFFSAKLPVFASFFFLKSTLFLLIFASVRDGRWVGRRWFQPLHEGVTPWLPPPLCLFHRVSTNFRVKLSYGYALTHLMLSWRRSSSFKGWKKLPLILIGLKGLPFLRNEPDFWVKFQRAALSSLIKNATSVKITKSPTPYNPYMGFCTFHHISG